MARYKSKKAIVITILIAVVGWFFKNKDGNILDNLLNGATDLLSSPASVSVDGLSPVIIKGNEYDVLENCTLVDHKHNDGDSFHIKHANGQDEIRLYFADTAESTYKTYGGGENNGDRLDKQARDFGGLTREQTTQVGQLGKKRTLSLVKGKKFKVITKRQPVTDRKSETRIYAFVVLENDGTEYYLHELLTQEGLVRHSTWGTDLPDGTPRKKQEARLTAMENDAKKRKVGAWGMN